MNKQIAVLLVAGMFLVPVAVLAGDESKEEKKEEKQAEKQEKQEAKAEENRDEIDAMAKATMKELFEKSDRANKLWGKAYGYAVFSAGEAKLLLSTGNGRGVARKKAGGDPIYMRMASAGLGVGLGYQRIRVVFMFETEQRYTSFVTKGWDGDASASASAATAGANAQASFADGMATFQFTKAGLIAQASLNGTKYWKPDKLNDEGDD